MKINLSKCMSFFFWIFWIMIKWNIIAKGPGKEEKLSYTNINLYILCVLYIICQKRKDNKAQSFPRAKLWVVIVGPPGNVHQGLAFPALSTARKCYQESLCTANILTNSWNWRVDAPPLASLLVAYICLVICVFIFPLAVFLVLFHVREPHMFVPAHSSSVASCGYLGKLQLRIRKIWGISSALLILKHLWQWPCFSSSTH